MPASSLPLSAHLEPWPYYGQLSDWTSDGQADENASMNCGPESVAMWVKYTTGVELPADFIKDVMYGEGYRGYTDTSHLASFIARYTGTAVQQFDFTKHADREGYHWRIQHALSIGHAPIGIFHFSSPSASDGHFRVYNGYNQVAGLKLYTADPWTGERREQFGEDDWAWAYGFLVIPQRRRCIES